MNAKQIHNNKIQKIWLFAFEYIANFLSTNYHFIYTYPFAELTFLVAMENVNSKEKYTFNGCEIYIVNHSSKLMNFNLMSSASLMCIMKT